MTQPSQLDLTCGKKTFLVFEKSHLALIKFTLIDALFIPEKVKKRFNFRYNFYVKLYLLFSVKFALGHVLHIFQFLWNRCIFLSPSWMENQPITGFCNAAEQRDAVSVLLRLRTQHTYSSQGSIIDCHSRVQCAKHLATVFSTNSTESCCVMNPALAAYRHMPICIF